MVPWLNKNLFSKIWKEETRPVVAREVIDRVKELCIDGDVPAKTAVLMAAKENDVEEATMLAAFNADDAEELIKILKSKKPNFIPMLLKKITNHDRKNMRG
jgi:hypothetical protein